MAGIMDDDRGYYLLLLCIGEAIDLWVGRRIRLEPGLYIYIGSAQNSLYHRLKRHIKYSKRIHWHIDKITTWNRGRILGVAVCQSNVRDLEPCISRGLYLRGYRGPEGYGSSDKPESATHLYKISGACSITGGLEAMLIEVLDECCTGNNLK